MPTNSDCVRRLHASCSGITWDATADKLTDCTCPCHSPDPEEGTAATAEQLYARLLREPADRAVKVLRDLQDSSREAWTCHAEDHPGMIRYLERRSSDLARRIADALETLAGPAGQPLPPLPDRALIGRTQHGQVFVSTGLEDGKRRVWLPGAPGEPEQTFLQDMTQPAPWLDDLTEWNLRGPSPFTYDERPATGLFQVVSDTHLATLTAGEFPRDGEDMDAFADRMHNLPGLPPDCDCPPLWRAQHLDVRHHVASCCHTKYVLSLPPEDRPFTVTIYLTRAGENEPFYAIYPVHPVHPDRPPLSEARQRETS